MSTMLIHAPLALFTTLGSLGVGSFIALAIAFSKETFTEDELKRIDKFALIPLLFLALAFICALFHLASPMHALGVVKSIGHSPLSNEVAMGLVTFLAAVVYWVLAYTEKLKINARKIFSIVLAALAILFGAMCGLAYWVETIVSWAHVGTVFEMVGFTLAGMLIGSFLIEKSTNRQIESASLINIIGCVGIIAAILGAAYQAMIVNGFVSPILDTQAMLNTALPFLITGSVLALIASALLFKKNAQIPAIAILVIGILLIRIAFYLLEVSICF